MKTTKKLNGLMLRKQTIANLEKKAMQKLFAGADTAATCFRQITCPYDYDGKVCNALHD